MEQGRQKLNSVHTYYFNTHRPIHALVDASAQVVHCESLMQLTSSIANGYINWICQLDMNLLCTQPLHYVVVSFT